VLAIALALLVACQGGRVARPSPTIARPSATASPAVPCEPQERLDYHIHAHLAIFIEGAAVTVPPSVGITLACVHWLHTHDSSGVLHVEAPASVSFTLGDFFRVWGQPLSSTQLLDRRADAAHTVRAWLDGQPFAGDPGAVPLHQHAVIVVQYGPPFVAPPAYVFRLGL
jgi:hypothetical protein